MSKGRERLWYSPSPFFSSSPFKSLPTFQRPSSQRGSTFFHFNSNSCLLALEKHFTSISLPFPHIKYIYFRRANKYTQDPEVLPPATADLARALSASQPTPEYLHTGRGGAGNWLKPTDLTSSGLTQTSSPDPTSIAPTSSSSSSTDAGPSTSSSSSSLTAPPVRPGIGVSKRVLGGSKPSYKGGRGGAGNYTDFEAEEKARREEE